MRRGRGPHCVVSLCIWIVFGVEEIAYGIAWRWSLASEQSTPSHFPPFQFWRNVICGAGAAAIVRGALMRTAVAVCWSAIIDSQRIHAGPMSLLFVIAGRSDVLTGYRPERASKPSTTQ